MSKRKKFLFVLGWILYGVAMVSISANQIYMSLRKTAEESIANAVYRAIAQKAEGRRIVDAKHQRLREGEQLCSCSLTLPTTDHPAGFCRAIDLLPSEQ